jgi:hypothetical protein
MCRSPVREGADCAVKHRHAWRVTADTTVWFTNEWSRGIWYFTWMGWAAKAEKIYVCLRELSTVITRKPYPSSHSHYRELAFLKLNGFGKGITPAPVASLSSH